MAEKHAQQQAINNVLEQAKQSITDEQWGNLPGEIRKAVEDSKVVPEKPIHWERWLKVFATSAVGTDIDFTLKRISKRFGTRPGVKKEDVCSIYIGIDTSGSISDGYLGSFFDEIDKIRDLTEDIWVGECDTQLGKEYLYKGNRPKEFTGGGGTDLEPLFEAAMKRRVDGLVLFTDCYAPTINKKYRFPVLVVNYGKGDGERFYKWGKYVKFNPKVVKK